MTSGWLHSHLILTCGCQAAAACQYERLGRVPVILLCSRGCGDPCVSGSESAIRIDGASGHHAPHLRDSAMEDVDIRARMAPHDDDDRVIDKV